MRRKAGWRMEWLLAMVSGLVPGAGSAAWAQGSEMAAVEFDRDIRPLLTDRCYACHGPDEAARTTQLRFDTREGAFADLGGYRAIVPGDPERSEMFKRITAAEEARRMPPVYSGLELDKKEIELIRSWIEQGARWQRHWSFIPPERPVLPQVADEAWTRNPIDTFVLDRLRKERLGPSPGADETVLIRRVTLDLTGLPPTPEEVDAFLADDSPRAYENVVDRLLRSPRYGEHMALNWLDAARYADSNGYQTDGERTMWRWRDWVIEAFNANMPFDRFTVEQLAGDMLPQPTLEQRIATGFNRNHRGNGEGGIIADEFAVEYVVDRVETTATVWLGLTLGCARCHDHKYDPFSQKEFYRTFAFFNNIPERGKVYKYGNSPPIIKAPTRPQQEQLAELQEKLDQAERDFQALEPELDRAQRQWETSFRKQRPLHWSIAEGLLGHFPLDGRARGWRRPLPASAKGNQAKSRFKDGRPEFSRGKIGKAAGFDGRRFIDAGDLGDFGFYDRFSLGAWIYPEGEQGGAIVSRTLELEKEKGYRVALLDGKVHVNLVVRWLDDSIRVETERTLAPDRWHHLMVTYDGSRTSKAIRIYVDGKPEKFKVLVDDLNLTFENQEPFRIGSGGGAASRFHGLIDEVRVYDRALPPHEVKVVATSTAINHITRKPPDRRSQAETDKLRAYFLQKHAPKPVRQAHRRILDLQKQKTALLETVPTTMVMQEREEPRETFLLLRGAYDQPGEKVSPGVPEILGGGASGRFRNRLDLARWLVDPGNPLTPRVVVNRYWQRLFGRGLVATVEDFGSQGERPTHPALLDWLATEFVRTGWDLKALQKTLVMSATYRQSSRATPELLARDPENLLLARGPRQRLSAQAIRDQALFVGGLLVEKLGGPSVKPYQPAGLWEELAGDIAYNQSTGEDLYRRSLYTFWKRTIAPPSMMNFDAAAREMCTVRVSRTNTPLQALNLMNDVTFVEAARGLAQRVLSEPESRSHADRIARAFRLATSRRPTAEEGKILLASLEAQLASYRSDRKAARELVDTGESPLSKGLDSREVAAYTAVASLILNLDETITKE